MHQPLLLPPPAQHRRVWSNLCFEFHVLLGLSLILVVAAVSLQDDRLAPLLVHMRRYTTAATGKKAAPWLPVLSEVARAASSCSSSSLLEPLLVPD
jgi:hypothetical protein